MDTDVLVLLPVFNDWDAVRQLLPLLDNELAKAEYAASVLIVDDASTTNAADGFMPTRCDALGAATVLRLRRNVGHQRAIAIGLAYAENNQNAKVVVVMDADGEDAPQDVPRLVRRVIEDKESRIVFAERTRRAEGFVFQACYRAYQLLHLMLTGIRVRVGNFSAIPWNLLSSLMVVSEVWNHYAAAVFKSRIPYETIPTRRRERLSGHSHMNFVGLVIHGLSALSVHGELIGVRVVVVTSLAIAIFGLSAVAAFLIHTLVSPLSPWALVSAAVLGGLLFHIAFLALIFVFVILQTRINMNFLPIRDHHYFIQSVSEVPVLTKTAVDVS